MLINGRGKVRVEKLKNQKVFSHYSQAIDHFYENLEDFNPAKKRRLLIVFNGMITDTESDKKLSLLVTEFLLKGKNLNISLAFISLFYFKVPKTLKLNTIHYFIIKI